MTRLEHPKRPATEFGTLFKNSGTTETTPPTCSAGATTDPRA
jgi:hypothetical protein